MFSNWHTPTLFYSLRVYHWKEFLKANFNVKETFSQLKTYTFTILTGSFISLTMALQISTAKIKPADMLF